MVGDTEEVEISVPPAEELAYLDCELLTSGGGDGDTSQCDEWCWDEGGNFCWSKNNNGLPWMCFACDFESEC